MAAERPGPEAQALPPHEGSRPVPHGRLRHEVQLFLLALQFLTRLPLPRDLAFEPAWLQQSARHFPGVGLLLGALLAALLAALAQVLPPLPAVLLVMGAGLWLTGAFHEDGLADTADALGGAVSRERALEIMKDSRIGSYGSAALWLALSLKAAALHALLALDLRSTCAALLLAQALSRAVPLLLMRSLPYAGDAEQAKAKPLATRIGAGGLGVATVWVVLAMAAALGLAPALTLTAVAAVLPALGGLALLLRRWLRRRLGGFTGDTLGAAQQLAELLTLLLLLAWLGAPLRG